jgi:16S rRNA (adenine1518-N6/adenine1519-N6)-dimethyltransferase
MARQRLGQHFLSAAVWQERILETLPRGPGETWVEIGAGHGEMTQHLAARARRVVAIETDSRLAAKLREDIRAHPNRWPGVEIVPGDVLELDLGQVAGAEKFRVYGNLPYYITSPILRRLFGCADRILSIHIIVQYEVAARIVSRPGHREYGYLSAACQFYTHPEIALKIPPGAFRPPPQVQSALVAMTFPGGRRLLGIKDEAKFLNFVQLCFGHKRKTLRNNLRAIVSDDRIEEALEAASLRPDARAEQLSLAQFSAMFAALG